MLRWRLLLGVLFIGALVGWVVLDARAEQPGAWLFWLALVVGIGAAGEAIHLIAAAGIRPLKEMIYVGTFLVLASNAVPFFISESPDESPLQRLAWPAAAFALSVLLILIEAIRRYEKPGGSMASVGASVFAVAYVGLLLSFAVQLRVLGGPEIGLIGLVAMIATVKCADIGAYTIGRLFGRHKMAPLVSPGKTMEGAAGAVLFACLGAWLTLTYLTPVVHCTEKHWPGAWLIFGVTVGLAGLFGDLSESLLKRDAGLKDSSAWLPGFGGILDLLDSILFASPVAYLVWLYLVQ